MNAPPLYRQEVLDARRQAWLGSISLAQPLRWWVFTAAAFTLALAVLGLLTFGAYTRRSTVAGQLVPDRGVSSVLAPGQGVVAAAPGRGSASRCRGSPGPD